MCIDDILTEFRVTSPPRAEPWRRFQAELRDCHRNTAPSVVACVRRAFAAALVHAGVRLDRRAGERALNPNTR